MSTTWLDDQTLITRATNARCPANTFDAVEWAERVAVPLLHQLGERLRQLVTPEARDFEPLRLDIVADEEMEALVDDKARLDWLESQRCILTLPGASLLPGTKTLRETIDAPRLRV